MRLTTPAALVVLAASACQGRDISRIASGGVSTGSSTGGTSSGVSSSSASSGGTTQGVFASGSGATGTGTGTGGATTGASSGTSGTTTGSPYWDGGYVFCSLAFAADGGHSHLRFHYWPVRALRDRSGVPERRRDRWPKLPEQRRVRMRDGQRLPVRPGLSIVHSGPSDLRAPPPALFPRVLWRRLVRLGQRRVRAPRWQQ